MQQRQMSNGTVIKRARAPNGEGHVYYVDGGPAGMVVVMDTYLTDLSIISACSAWELDNKPGELVTPKLNFNDMGYRQ